MSEWKEVVLGDLVTKITKGTTPPKGKGFAESEGINYIKSDAIEYDGTVDQKKFVLIDKETHEKFKRSQLEEGDILFSMAGNYLGKSGIVTKEMLPANTNQALAIIRLKQNLALPQYIGYCFRQPNMIRYVNSMSAQSAQPNINFQEIGSLFINLPEIGEQKQIINVLGNLDQKITLLREQNQTLEELAQTLFKRWFVEFEFPNEKGQPYKSSGGKMVESELGEIPEGWRVGHFDEIIEFNNGYAFSSKELLDEPSKTTLAVFKMGHIKKGGGFNPSKSKSYIESEKSIGLEKYILKKGDLLMCMTDMKDNSSLLGHTALMPVDGKYIVNQRVGLIRAKNDSEINYPYLYILTNSKTFLAEIRSRANSGVQVNLSTNGIKETETIIPSKEVNTKFHSVCNQLFEKILTNQEEIQSLIQLRDTLLPKLMSGELRVKE